MRKGFFACAIATVVSMFATSCAKVEEETIEDKRERSFEAWVAKNAPNAEKIEGGVYIEKLYESTQAGALTPSGDGEDDFEWVMINYTGREMTTGNVFVTRDPDIAKHQGTFTNYTHYTAEYVPYTPYNALYYSSNVDMIMGNFLALGQMKEGDKYRVYIPSSLAYGSSGYSYESSGYEGQNALGGDLPVIMDLELVKVVKDPSKYEASLVQNYAVTQMKLNLSDTIRTNLYCKHISYGKELRDTVKKDETISIYYVGRFMDGFVFDTNIKDTAEKYNLAQYYEDDHYEVMTVDVGTSEEDENEDASSSSDENSVVVGLDAALLKMLYGESSQIIFTSTYGYGESGQFPTYSNSSGTIVASPVIPPYTPLIFDVTVAPKYGDGTKQFPYTFHAITERLGEVDGVWVEGYVAGVALGDDYTSLCDTLTTIVESGVKTNLMLSDGTYEVKPEECFTVELPEGEIRDALNVPDNDGDIFRQKVKLYGNLRQYLGTYGIVDITDYSFE